MFSLAVRAFTAIGETSRDLCNSAPCWLNSTTKALCEGIYIPAETATLQQTEPQQAVLPKHSDRDVPAP